MAVTTLSNLIVPEVFNPYVTERTAELSAFWQSGIVENVSEISPAPNGGAAVQMPFFKDLTGEDNLLDEADNIVASNITAARDVAVVHAREKAWGATDLSKAFSGADPMAAIAELVAGFWARRMQAVLIASVNGAMGAVTDNVLDISALEADAGVIDGASFIDATQCMGDAKDRLGAVAMHSATEAYLAKRDLIEYIKESEGSVTIPYFMGKRVIVDDNMPVSSGVYTTYLFGQGAVGYADANTPVPTETHRDPKARGGLDELITRRHFVLHPRGVAWVGTPAKLTPSNAELATSGNWDQRYESKNIRIVKFVHKIG